MPQPPPEIHAAASRVRAEFMEMPGLCLTIPQASRLWGLDAAVCQDVINAFVNGGFLRWTPDGLVTRAEGAR